MKTYRDCGVDVEKGEALVERIKKRVQGTYGPQVVSGVGGFSCLYDMGDGRYLSAGTDGVGTKIKLAQALGIHNTIGIDLVAMCANDVVCCGARPLFFLDYLATGKLDLEVSDQLIEGIVRGCQESQMPLLGGETAEMPGVYASGEYDLAGFCVGEVRREELIDGHLIEEGDLVLGLSSSGFHSNGYSLVRQWVREDEKELLQQCLTPTKLYVQTVLRLKQLFPQALRGLAHITGGGMRNLLRVHADWGYHLHSLPAMSEVPPVIRTLVERMQLPWEELYKTLNMGVGLMMVVQRDQAERMLTYLREWGEAARIMGEVIPQKQALVLKVDGQEIKLD